MTCCLCVPASRPSLEVCLSALTWYPAPGPYMSFLFDTSKIVPVQPRPSASSTSLSLSLSLSLSAGDRRPLLSAPDSRGQAPNAVPTLDGNVDGLSLNLSSALAQLLFGDDVLLWRCEVDLGLWREAGHGALAVVCGLRKRLLGCSARAVTRNRCCRCLCGSWTEGPEREQEDEG